MKLYLASPYSHSARRIREQRYDKAVLHAGLLINKGHIVYSPIAHNHPIAEVHGLPTDWNYWQQFDRAFIEWCEALIVLMIPGWQQSQGISEEKKIAIELKRPVIHWDPQTYELPDLNEL